MPNSGEMKTPVDDKQRDERHPQGRDADGAAEQARDDAGRREQDRHAGADHQHRRHFADARGRRSRDEVLLQQVVGDGRLHLDAGKQRVERRGDDLARAEGVGADEDDLVANRVRRYAAAHHVGRGQIAERPFLPAVAQQQVASRIQRHPDIVNRQHRVVDRRDVQRDVLCARDGRHGRKRQAGIETAAELRHERHPPQDSVGVRRGVEEAGCASRICQNRQVADRVVRREERRPARFARRLHYRDPDRVEHARARHVAVRLEGESVAENHAAALEGASEDAVGLGRRGRVGIRPRRGVPVRLRQHDVERDNLGARRPEPLDQLRDQIAAPGPLSDGRQAALVDVDDRDAIRGRPRADRTHHHVVDRVIEPDERLRPQDGHRRHEQHGNDR